MCFNPMKPLEDTAKLMSGDGAQAMGGLQDAMSTVGGSDKGVMGSVKRWEEGDKLNSLYSKSKIDANQTINTGDQGVADSRRAGAMGLASTRAALIAQEKIKSVKQTLGA